MSGLYNNNSSYFSPARAAFPQIRSTPEIDSFQYLTELLAEHQKLTPFMQVLPICSRLLNQELEDMKFSFTATSVAVVIQSFSRTVTIVSKEQCITTAPFVLRKQCVRGELGKRVEGAFL